MHFVKLPKRLHAQPQLLSLLWTQYSINRYGSTYEALTQQKPKRGIYFKYMHNYSDDSG